MFGQRIALRTGFGPHDAAGPGNLGDHVRKRKAFLKHIALF